MGKFNFPFASSTAFAALVFVSTIAKDAVLREGSLFGSSFERNQGEIFTGCDEELGRGAGSSLFSVVPRKDKTFGADLYNFDAAAVVEDDVAVSRLQAALEEHLVLVLHNVTQEMTPEVHVRLAKKLGPVDPARGTPDYLKKGIYNSPKAVQRNFGEGSTNIAQRVATSMLQARMEAQHLPREITRIVKLPSESAAFGEGAHSDLTFYPAPPMAAMLASRELPQTGLGNTHFWDMRSAYDRLPEATQQKIRFLKANHTDGAEHMSTHPMVRSDNKHDRLSLFVNRAFTRNIIFDQEEESDLNLLEDILEYIEDIPTEQPDMFLNVTWSEGQMVMWDNRFTQHAAQSDYPSERREVQRVIISGTAPF